MKKNSSAQRLQPISMKSYIHLSATSMNNLSVNSMPENVFSFKSAVHQAA